MKRSVALIAAAAAMVLAAGAGHAAVLSSGAQHAAAAHRTPIASLAGWHRHRRCWWTHHHRVCRHWY